MRDPRSPRESGPGDPSATQPQLDDGRVLAAAEEFLVELEAGRSPSREEFLRRYPEIAVELADCLDGLQILHRAAPDRGHAPAVNSLAGGEPLLPLGDFRLVREIGRGGMGVVYEAIQSSLGRRVAVKVLPLAAALDPRHLQRFKHEAQAAAQLHHSNIVPVHAVGSDRGVHYYAMQLIDGESLAAVIRHLRARDSRPALPGEAPTLAVDSTAVPTGISPNAALVDTPLAHSPPGASATHISQVTTRKDFFRLAAEMIRQAALALEHAHQFGVVHRDIKPANLLVDTRGSVWVTDFGLAQMQADVALTRTGDLLGTLRYMSPEQAAGDRVVLDHRTDIYSLGVTFYELLTLEPVFADSDRQSLLRRIVTDDPRPPRAIDKHIPVELETIVLKAIAKSPGSRYATAQQMADDLERWLADKPILARRPNLLERAAKFGRRHRSLVASAGVFTVLALLGLLASTILIAREQAKTQAAYERELAERNQAEASFRQARRAVDTFTQLGEDELADNPALGSLRRKFLAASLEYYRGFLEQNHDDPEVRAELAAASERVAQIIDSLAAIDGYAPLSLLSEPEVQQELALSATQREQLTEPLAQLHEETEQAQTGGRRTVGAERQQQLAETLRAQHERVAAVLSAAQMQRVRQIAWQQQTPFVFRTDEIITALGLTPEQRKQVSRIIEEESPAGRHGHGPDGHGPGGPPPSNDDGFGPRHGGPGSHEHRPPPDEPWDWLDDRRGGPSRHDDDHGPGSMTETKARTTKRIVDEVLTAAQRAKWEQLIGKPFDYDLNRRPEDWTPR